MPIDYSRYHPAWHRVSRWIRTVRSGGRCECLGECGLHRTTPGPRRCVERNGEPARWARGRIVLTVAHLCHDTQCVTLGHLRAMCQRCHLRYDRVLHAQHAAETRRALMEAAGQQRLF